MRAYIGRLLFTDTTMNLLGINRDSLYSGDADTPPERPYIVLRWGDTTPGVGRDLRVDTRTLTVWIHDKGNDYAVIDSILGRVKTLMLGLYAVRTETGYITQVEWVTDSSDLADDETRTILRTSTYAIVASGQ